MFSIPYTTRLPGYGIYRQKSRVTYSNKALGKVSTAKIKFLLILLISTNIRNCHADFRNPLHVEWTVMCML